MSESDIDHRSVETIVCPHCGYRYMEPWELGDSGKADCACCKKSFSYYRDVIWTTEPIASITQP